MKLSKLFPFTRVLTAILMIMVVLAGCEKDEDPAVPPSVNSTNPVDKATNIAVNSALSFTFNVAMNPSSITNTTFTLKHGNTSVAGTTAYSDKTASFVPSADLAPNTLYTATISTGVKNARGNPLANNYVWTFTTAVAPDILLPVVNTMDPLNHATGIARNKVITFTFSEPMDPSTVNNTNIILEEGTNAVSGTVSYSGTTATFTPASILAANTAYKATIKTGVKDIAGNALASNIVTDFTTGGTASTLAAVNLGTSGNYVILAKSAINNGSTSAITGDMAISPAAMSYITGLALTNATGYATSAQVTGKVYAADMADPTPINLTTAVGDMITAYNDAAGRPSPDFSELATGNLGGKTLSPGLYKWTSTVTLPSDVVISGGANDVWIFQISGDLLTSSAVNVTLAGGAQAKNIFWQVAGQATFGTSSHFEGIILSKTGITFQTTASINGRALAQTAVVLDSNAITKPQ
ncbi:MAG: ice-binding family protein [Cyclobacteriaceae bacterium]